MTFGEMQAEYMDQLSYGDAPSPIALTRMRRNLNLAYRELLGKKGLGRLRRKVLTFASVASTPFATLPLAASKVIIICDRTNMIPLDEISLQDIRFNDPGNVSSSSAPYAYAIQNLAAPVNRDPTAAAELFVKSTSAIDGAGLTAYITGVVTGGYQRTVSIPMNGVTAVSLASSITTWESITKFYLSSPAKGDVTLTMTSGAGTELAFIPYGKAMSRYSRIILFPPPSAAVTYYADVELAVEDLVNLHDEPIFQEDFHWIITCSAMMRELLKKEKAPQYAAEKARLKEGISELISFLRTPSGLSRRRTLPRRFSQLGANFPTGG